MTTQADVVSYFSRGGAEAVAELELGTQIELGDSVSRHILNMSEDKCRQALP